MFDLQAMQAKYADLLIRAGVNLQHGQCLMISCEPSHRTFVQLLAEAAYRAGAKYVEAYINDTPIQKARVMLSDAQYLDYYPPFEVARRRMMIDENWARLVILGPEFPDIMNDVDPKIMQGLQKVRMQHTGFFLDATMANEIQWCIASIPTPEWARKIFPDVSIEQAVDKLWRAIFTLVRVDQADSVGAWRAHDAALMRVSNYLNAEKFAALHFVDSKQIDGKPATDLYVGLTDAPHWVAASSVSTHGTRFFPNMPTEEIFTSPHSARTHGHVRLSKPAYLFGRELHDAYFRFEHGEVVEFRAAKGEDALAELMAMNGARRLGEVALVDVRSPVNQTGILFYESLFDENAASHIAFGRAYPEGMQGAGALSDEQQAAAGLNKSDAHEDLMIGCDTMDVFGVRADGSAVAIMRSGKFII